MDRRRFLAAGIATLAAPAVSRAQGLAAAFLGSARVALQLSSMRDALARDLDRTLAAVAAIGYREVELFSPYLSGPRTPMALRAALDRAGLAAVSTHVSTALLYRGWGRHLAAATTLGCRYVVCGDVAPEERHAARDWYELAAVFNRAGEAARTAGLWFGYEVRDVELARIQGVAPYNVVLDETDPALVGFELDLAGVARSGADPLAVLGRAPNRFFALHVRDARAANDLTRTVGRARMARIEHVVVGCDTRLDTAVAASVRRDPSRTPSVR